MKEHIWLGNRLAVKGPDYVLGESRNGGWFVLMIGKTDFVSVDQLESRRSAERVLKTLRVLPFLGS